MEKKLQHKIILYIISIIYVMLVMIVALYIDMPLISANFVAFSVGELEGVGIMFIISNLIDLIKIYKKETVQT